MLNWFRKGPSPHQTALAMIGAGTGDRVLFVGGDQPNLVAELALATGLNGEVVVAAPAGRLPAIESAAGRAGALVELVPYETGPVPAGSREFDIAIWAGSLAAETDHDRRTQVNGLVATLRPGGRVLLIDGAPAGRFGGSREAHLPKDAGVDLLTGAGALAARLLATADGLAYYEARKRR